MSKPKPKRKKHGRPEAGKGVSNKLLETMAIKHDGSPTAMANELGISQPTASKHLQKPAMKKAVISARARAIKAAGLTRIKAYKQLADQLSAKKAGEIIIGEGKTARVQDAMIPDFLEQDKARKDFLKIVGDYTETPENPTQAPIVQMPVIYIDNRKMHYDIGKEIVEDVADV